MYPSSGKLTLKALFGEYPKTQALRDGAIPSDLVELDVSDIKVAQLGFPALVRDLAFDVAEVAIMTFLIARDHGKPYALLPFVMNGAFHHGSLYYNVASGVREPKDLEGRKIGLRSYTQTTPTWVRGYMQDDYGVDLKKVTWVTFEDAHVAEYQEPAGVERAAEGKKLANMLLEGEVAAAMLGQGAPEDPRIAPLIANPKEAALDWHKRTGAVPINHMVVVRQELVKERPDVVRELYRMLIESRDRSGGSKIQDGVDLQPAGLENVRNAVQLAADYGLQQGLIRNKVSVDELFDEVTGSLTA